MDVLAAFIEDCCVVHADAHVGSTPLYNAYRDWCDGAGENQMTRTKFGLRLKERGFENVKVQTVTWYGIGLLDSSGPDPGPEEPDKGPEEPPNPLTVDSSDPNPLTGESRIPMRNEENPETELRQSRPEIDINGLETPREGANPKKGLNPLNPLKPSNEDAAEQVEDEGSPVSQVHLNAIKHVFKQRHMHPALNRAFGAFQSKATDKHFNEMCVEVCRAARLDDRRFTDYSDAIMDEYLWHAESGASAEKGGPTN